MRLKIPNASDKAVILAFSDGVIDLKMKEELSTSDEMSTALKIFNLANKCSRAEEGRLSLLGPQAAEPEEKKAKANEVKRKAPAVLAAEPEAEYGQGGERPSGGGQCASSMAPAAMIPLSAKSSGWPVLSSSADALDGERGAPSAAEAAAGSAGMTESHLRDGVSSLVKTIGAASLRRTAGATTLRRGNDAVSLVRFALVRMDWLLCLHHTEGGMKTGRTRGLGASRRLGRWPPSWAAPRPCPPTAPSNSSHGR
ncbi:hypothetical protein ZWY2020_041299 [Hordeum vulgare]|nr:hypothetical protein ZWY2020_041299 [Hordeum vulgare]